MADCSELAENLVKIGMNLATQEEIKAFDDMVMAMQQIFPALTREAIVDAFLEVQQSRSQETNDLQKKLLAIYNEPRIEKNTKDKIKELNDLLESGEVSKKKGRKAASLKIEQLRNTRDNLRNWLETGDPAMKKKLDTELGELTKAIESGDVELKSRQGKLHDEILEIKNQIDELKKQISERRNEQQLLDKIEMLQSHLEAGTLPQTTPRIAVAAEATQALRSVIYDLRKELNRSEPARKKRIEKSIADLEEKLRTGDILPKPRPPLAESKELDNLIFKRDLVKKEITDLIRSATPLSHFDRAWKYLDLARLIMTTGEFSFALRQGGVYALSHPLKWAEAMVNTFKAFASAEGLYEVNKQIYARDNAPNYNKAGLILLHEGMSLSQTEEVIMNYWQDKLPVIRNFNRAAIGFFNTMRADMFDMGYQTLGVNGAMTLDEMKIWANYINVMSGRGRLGKIEPIALALNRAFFSSRYIASRFQMLTGAIKNPLLSIAGQNKRVHRMIVREYIRLGLGLATIYGLGMLVGADIEDDPRSSDFGKLKFGNRRLDVLMGHGQIITFMSRILTGHTKTVRGNVVPIRGEEVPYGGQDIEKILFRFFRSKLSPQFGFAMNLITGKTYLGDEVYTLNTLTRIPHPITYGDIWDVMKEDGMPVNLSLTVLTFLGMGLQTYEVKDKSSFGGRES